MSSNQKQKFDEKLDSFVMCPRSITDDYRGGKLTPSEYSAYCYLRHLGNPYGITHTSLENIVKDVFQEKISPNSINKVNKIVLALRKKRYIYYPNRSGRTGSFQIHFGDWRLPNGAIKDLEPLFNPTKQKPHQPTEPKPIAEVEQILPSNKQKLEAMKTHVNIGNGGNPKTPISRGAYNDKDNDTHNDIIIDSNNKIKNPSTYKGVHPLSGFKPSNGNEARCLEIACALGETYMDYLLHILKTRGDAFIERAFGLYKEQARITNIDDPPAYFNKLIQELAIKM